MSKKKTKKRSFDKLKTFLENGVKAPYIGALPELDGSPDSEYFIYLDGKTRSEDDGITARCTCGWFMGPSQKMMELGRGAATHSTETGHIMRRV